MPELVKFEDWSPTSDLSDPVDLKIAHADYIRESYFEEGTYNEEIEQIVNNRLYQSLMGGESGLTQDQISGILNAPYVPSFEEKAQSVTRSRILDPRSKDSAPIRDYNAFLKVKASGEGTDEFLAKEEELLGKASAIADKYYDKAVDRLRAEGASPFVRIPLPDGGYYLKGGPAADGLTPYQAYRKSVDAGFLQPRDIRGVQRAMAPFGDSGVPLYKRANYEEALVAINSILEKAMTNPNIQSEPFYEALSRYSNRFRDLRRSPDYDAGLREDVVEELEYALPDTENIPIDDRLAAVEYVAGHMAMSGSVIKFDNDNISNNVRKFGYGELVIHGDLLPDKELFEKAIKEGYTEQEQAVLRGRRKSRLNGAMFSDFNEVINRTHLSSEWNEAVSQGFLDDKEEYEIFDDFFKDRDYEGFRNEFVGSILRSIPDSISDTAAALTVAATSIGGGTPNEFALDVLLKNQKDREARSRLANMMGDEVGMVTTIGGMVAPVIVDIAATALLTSTTAVGGAAYLVAKTGARITAKGITAGIVKGALRRKTIKGVTETIEEAAERVATTNLIKSFGKQKKSFVGAAGVTDVAAKKAFEKASAVKIIEKYNKVAANRLNQSVAMFVPAATRSGGMTYGSVYSALPDDMSPEEKHQKALGAGLLAATVTGSLVVGFRFIGMGGLEDFIVGRATTGQMRKTLEHLSSRSFSARAFARATALKEMGDIPPEIFDRALAKIVAEGVKKNWRSLVPTRALGRLAKGFKDEALEEGLDEFINSFIQTGATGEDMSFADRIKNAGMAAIYGGIFGASMPLFQRTLGHLARGAAAFEEEYLAKRDVATRVADELKKAGSPMSAEAVQDVLDAREREHIRDTDKPDDGSEPPAPEPPAPEPPAPEPTSPEPTPPEPATALPPSPAPEPVKDAAHFYGVLGLSEGATFAEIKAAYRRLVRMYHPDVSEDPMAEEKMKDINEAYEAIQNILADEIVRAARDSSPEEQEEAVSAAMDEPSDPFTPDPESEVKTPPPVAPVFNPTADPLVREILKDYARRTEAAPAPELTAQGRLEKDLFTSSVFN